MYLDRENFPVLRYLELRHDGEIVSHNELNAVSHTVDVSIVACTGHLHWVNVYGNHCREGVGREGRGGERGEGRGEGGEGRRGRGEGGRRGELLDT